MKLHQNVHFNKFNYTFINNIVNRYFCIFTQEFNREKLEQLKVTYLIMNDFIIIHKLEKYINQKSWERADRKQKKSCCDQWSQSTQITSALLTQSPHTGLWHIKRPMFGSVCSSF